MSICKDFKPLGKERCVYEAERTSYTCVCGLKSRNCKIFNPIIESSHSDTTQYFFETYTSIHETRNSINNKHIIQFDLYGIYEDDLKKIKEDLSPFSPLGKLDSIQIEVNEMTHSSKGPPIKNYKFKATNLVYDIRRNSTNPRFRTYSCSFIGEEIV